MSLDKLRQLEREATPGHWHAIPIGDGPQRDIIWFEEDFPNREAAWEQQERNAAFITAMRDAFPALLDMAETAKAVCVSGALSDGGVLIPDIGAVTDLQITLAGLEKLELEATSASEPSEQEQA